MAKALPFNPHCDILTPQPYVGTRMLRYKGQMMLVVRCTKGDTHAVGREIYKITSNFQVYKVPTSHDLISSYARHYAI